ncbi:polysaccharide pyruvyl transferase family protein [Enterovibrio makurazakiensis]|uniref:polysaccharide pyruvyl transferase family protein n=1 Tax=Enterovibrio makurazakiensis TaxID=2910232 RepID=UPI003D219AE5
MKYAITHCYTDHNKGDAAIIISTTQLLREIDKDAEINMFSTFGPNDDQFINEHEFIKKFSKRIYPGMFYQPRPVIKDNDKSRFLHLLWILVKFTVLLATRNKTVLKAFFTPFEREGIEKFLESDVVISKGGSYITAQNKSLRQSISLFSMLYPFILAKRYDKKMVIFSQSLGPVVGSFNKWMTKSSLRGIKKIFLREKVCLDLYPEVNELSELVDIEIIQDSAFFLESDEELSKHDLNIDSNNFNVGMTLVDHAFKYVASEEEKQEKINNYKNAITNNIKRLIDDHSAYIHIFPQVIANNSHLGHSDVRISKEIEDSFRNTKYDGRVKYHFADYNPMQLRQMYSEMDMFIGTRLHSVIFSLSQNVPSINIAYHGTKSQGILGAIKDFENNVISIDNITTEVLEEKIDYVINNRDLLIDTLVSENAKIRSVLLDAMKSVTKL